MKKVLFSLALIMFAASSFAQFTIWKDTVVYDGFPKTGVAKYKADSVFNTTSSPLTVTWNKTSDNLLSGWTGTGICDNATCFGYDNTPHNMVIPANSAGYIYVDMSAATTAADGCSYATIRVTDGGMLSKDMVYKYCTWPTNVNDLDNGNIVSIYPNPASNFVNININDKSIRNIQVVNVIGRKVAKFEVDANKNQSMHIPLDNVADGIYLLQFTNVQGKLVGVRRVTKQ
ncbi:MAG: T9SS type A sorting domain-containing protein [Chitinophagaceae bacterium]|nr:T9SS type A sorting domain-containing protein [Chitinophagaceae bacterium]